MSNALKVAAFDFDSTIINTNCDTYIDKLLLEIPEEQIDFDTHFDFRYPYPDHIDQLTYTHGWTKRMNAVFEYLFVEHGITQDAILNCISEVKIDKKMIEFLTLIKSHGYELIIISDANSIFIDEILKSNGIHHLFSTVYTNPAFFDSNGCLRVQPLNELINDDSMPFDCATKCCTRNLCKGFVFDRHVKSHQANMVDIEKIIYCGDGRNDYCAGLKLRSNDSFLVRKDFSLAKLLSKNNEYLCQLRSNIFYWKNGNEILELCDRII